MKNICVLYRKKEYIVLQNCITGRNCEARMKRSLKRLAKKADLGQKMIFKSFTYNEFLPKHPNIIAIYWYNSSCNYTWEEAIELYVKELNERREKYNENLKKVREIKNVEISFLEDKNVKLPSIFKGPEKQNLIGLRQSSIFTPFGELIVRDPKERHQYFYVCSCGSDENIFQISFGVQVGSRISNALKITLGKLIDIAPLPMLTSKNFSQEKITDPRVLENCPTVTVQQK